jgi:proteasome lid subunit RPN8/RPN11
MKQHILNYAAHLAPEEMCGFVLRVKGERQFFPVRNVAEQPLEKAVFDPDAWIDAEALGEVVALVHSHPNGVRVLSPQDRHAQLQTGLPWWVVTNGSIDEYPCVPSLLGREFDYGQVDCFTLMVDAYALAGHRLPNFNYDEDWWDHGQNLYIDNLPQHGFYPVSSPNPGDVLMIQLASDTANHCAIYIGDNQLLHHCPNRLSNRQPFGGYWRKHLHSIWRYQSWQSSDFMGIYNDLVASSNLTSTRPAKRSGP